MKKKYLIVAITALSFFAGISNNLQAQDSTGLSFGEYLTKTPWIINVGIDVIDDDGDRNPFAIKLFKSPTPFKVAIEKDVYAFKHWNFSKGLNWQFVIASTSLGYRTNTMVDLNLKYDLLRKKSNIDLYVLLGGGFTNKYPISTVTKSKEGSIEDNFLNMNLGGGLNYWVFDNVGINLQTQGKLALIAGDDHYVEYSAGLVFRIGGAAPIVEDEVKEEVSTYTRSKEAEDALIHLREHINK